MISGDFYGECYKERYPHSTAKLRLVQHCTAFAAITELVTVC